MPPVKQRLVLVVDDEEVVGRAFETAFVGQDEFVLDWAKGVREAFEKLDAIQFDLIFLDLKLDGNTVAGLQILREINRLEIRARSRGQPVISSLVVIMSASLPLSDIMSEAHELGVLCFLDKRINFTPAFIRQAVNRLGIPLLPPSRTV